MSTIIKHKEFTNHKVYKTEVAGRPLTIDVGKVAELATASAMVTYGETTVLVAVTVSPRPRDGVDFFPLSVDFEEKLYAVGRIPGSFMRREGQPSLPAVLASRVIDRSIRPLFPYDFRNDVVVTATVMSVDRDCSPDGDRHDRRVRLPGLLLHPLGRPHRLPGGGLCGRPDCPQPHQRAEARLPARSDRGRHRQEGDHD